MLRKAEIAEFMLHMLYRLRVEEKLFSAQIANAPHDYYSWDLETRK
jgi:hypothetical protein